MNHALESLSDVLLKNTNSVDHDAVECQRSMHFFTEAFATGYDGPDTLFTLYMGRSKLNLVTA